MINQTKNVHCNCTNEGQDKLHGKQVRVTTPCNKEQEKEHNMKLNNRTVRCTVCTKQHQIKI